MPTPLQYVHTHQRGVGELNEEDLLAGDRGEACRVRTTGQNMEAVETDSESGVVRCLDDAPGMVVCVDVAPPRKCLVGDADPVLVRQLGQFAQLHCGQGVVVAGVCGDVGASQRGVDAESTHDTELVLRPAHASGECVGGESFDVTHRLVEEEFEAQVRHPFPDLFGAERTAQQVVLEDLHTVEPGTGHGVELLRQRSTDRDGGDGRAHRDPSSGFSWLEGPV